MDNAQQDAKDVKESLKSRHGADCLEDVPRYAIFVEDIPVEIKTEWLDEQYNVKEIAYFVEKQLDILDYKAGIVDRLEEADWSNPEERSNVFSSKELGEIVFRVFEVGNMVSSIKNDRDRYSSRAESRQKRIERLEEKLDDQDDAGRLYHLKRLVLG